MRDWPISVIPNPIDINLWQPMRRNLAREILQLTPHVPIILFGAWNGTTDKNKGFDLLVEALGFLGDKVPNLTLVIFGESPPRLPLDLRIPVYYIGRISDSISLRLLYCAADATIVPSRYESFGQTASESHACGTPVIAFNTSGLKDIVEHERSGYLADSFNAADLAHGIEWTLSDKDRHSRLALRARERAVENWSYGVVASAYRECYAELISNSGIQ
jgi:glycosyltransferase involved in cell wall biosynthesis